MAEMLSSRPYLLRALHQWIVDSSLTPHVLVDAAYEGVVVPEGVRKGDKIVLNVAPQAVRDLIVDNETLTCVARFSGASHGISVPVDAVLAIYARETGQGMMFQGGDPGETGMDPASGGKSESRPANRKPDLKIIK